MGIPSKIRKMPMRRRKIALKNYIGKSIENALTKSKLNPRQVKVVSIPMEYIEIDLKGVDSYL